MDDELKTIEEAFENIPEEVKHYIYGKTFVNSFDKFCLEEGLTPEETVQFRGTLYGYLAQVETEEGLLKTIQSISKTIESNQKKIDWVKKEVTGKVLDLVVNAYDIDNFDEDEEESEEEVEKDENVETVESRNEEVIIKEEIVAPKTFSGIEERLKSSSTIAPTSRDYSMTKITELVDEAETKTTIKGVDAYREIPE
jgi:hypothetical protein